MYCDYDDKHGKAIFTTMITSTTPRLILTQRTTYGTTNPHTRLRTTPYIHLPNLFIQLVIILIEQPNTSHITNNSFTLA